MRTLDLIEYVVGCPSGVAAQEIAVALTIPDSSLSYLLATLVERQYLRREGRRYYAGEGLRRLRSSDGEYDLADRARPLLKSLRLQLNETASLFTRIGWEVEAAVTEVAGQPLRYSLDVGTRAPLHSVAAGKTLLAAMPDAELERYFAEVRLERFTEHTICDRRVLMREITAIRSRGVAFARNEYTLGIIAVAKAIASPGEAMSAISVAVPTLRMTPELEARIVDQVQRASLALGTGDLPAA